MNQENQERQDIVDMLQGIAIKTGSTFALIDNVKEVKEHMVDGKSIGNQLRDKELDQMSELLFKSAILSGSAFALMERQVEFNKEMVMGSARDRSRTLEILKEQKKILDNAHEVQRRLGMEE
jgi:hypothetical protein